MNSFLIPCISIIVVFWLGFGLTYFVLRGRVTRLERRIRRIERQMGGNTEDFSHQQPQPKPKPVAPSRYVTVDRQINPRYFR